MIHIIGEGGNTDRDALQVQTRERWNIPNFRKLESSTYMRALHEENLARHPRWQLRSIASGYNCMGLAFAARRTWIESDYFAKIVGDDGFREVSEGKVQPGDLIAYVRQREVLHVGVVLHTTADIARGTFDYTVLSKFGR